MAEPAEKKPLSPRSKKALLYSGLALVGAALADAVPESSVEPLIVTARLRAENDLIAPVSLTVVTRETLRASGTDGVAGLAARIPALGYSSPNPRNTALTIRGLGSSVAAVSQANDGLEPGVGFYVDGVYRARPAAAAFDLSDLERIEVLRGPQGTLFGKNTTAGAVVISTNQPTFDFEGSAELSLGNYEFKQARMAVSATESGLAMPRRAMRDRAVPERAWKSVAVGPGQTVVIRTRCGRNSWSTASDRARMNDLVAA
jgi:iron complex outermembrane receptor protein